MIEKSVVLGVRPEDVLIVADSDAVNSVDAKVDVAEPMGAETLLYLDSGVTHFIARVRSTDQFEFDQRVKVLFDAKKIYFFDPISENTL